MLSSRYYSLNEKSKEIKVLQVEDMKKINLEEKSIEKDLLKKEIGQTLEDYVKNRDYLESKEIYDIALSICDTIGSLNTLNYAYIFRSFTPSSIIVTSNRKVILTDNQISKLSQPNDNTYGIFNDYTHVKQQRLIHFSREKEIYNIGMIMYFMATGKVPATRLEPFIEDIYANTVESNLKRIIRKCFEIDVKKRYVSLEELNREIIIELLKKNKYKKTSELTNSNIDSSIFIKNSNTKKLKSLKSKRVRKTVLSKIKSTLSIMFL